MKKAKVSVIIPVFNASKYIDKCINSVINQSYKNYEIVAIDDGSKDDSLQILKKIKKKYNDKILLFSQPNKGESFARNKGLELATGDYILFLDSDDWIEKDYIYTLLDNIKDNDIVISGFKRYNFNYEYQYLKIPNNNSWSKFKYCSVAGKMFKFSFLKKHNLIYKKFKISEDAYFNINAYCYTTKISIAKYAGYCNYENKKSVTNQNQKNLDKNSFLINVLKSINSELPINVLDSKQLYFFYLKNIVMSVFLLKNLLTLQELDSEFSNEMKWFSNILNEKEVKMRLYYQNGEELKINIIINIFVIAYKFHFQKFLLNIIKNIEVKII